MNKDLEIFPIKDFVGTLSMSELASIITRWREKPSYQIIGARDILHSHAYAEWNKRYGARRVPRVLLDEEFIFECIQTV